jgi:hypothetical protein
MDLEDAILEIGLRVLEVQVLGQANRAAERSARYRRPADDAKTG